MSKRTFVALTVALVIRGLLVMVPVPADTDATPPTVGGITPVTAQLNVPTAFQASYSDNVGVASCDLYVDGSNHGAMSLSASYTTSGVALRSLTLAASGGYSLQARCTDGAGNVGSGSVTTVTVPGPTP